MKDYRKHQAYGVASMCGWAEEKLALAECLARVIDLSEKIGLYTFGHPFSGICANVIGALQRFGDVGYSVGPFIVVSDSGVVSSGTSEPCDRWDWEPGQLQRAEELIKSNPEKLVCSDQNARVALAAVGIELMLRGTVTTIPPIEVKP